MAGPIRELRALYVRSRIRDALPLWLKLRLRHAWVRLAHRVGYPISSPELPRPPLPRRRLPLRLTHALLACDLNPRYLGSWSYVARGWEEIAGVRPLLVLVADPAEAPAELLEDDRVRVFPPLPEVHTAFQAQCIRLLYPALVEGDGAVLISDMELLPLDPDYFHGPLRGLDRSFFVAYRDAVFYKRQIAIPYNAAHPDTWGEIFGVASLDDVRARLAEWAGRGEYRGLRGGPGWYTDQEVLYEHVVPWAERTRRFWMLDDEYAGHNRLNRPDLKREGGVNERRRRELVARRYSDYNSAVPFDEYAELNELVLSLALQGLRRPPVASLRPFRRVLTVR